MDKDIFTLRNLDVDDIKVLELAIGLEPNTIPLKQIPADAKRKAHMFMTIGYFDNRQIPPLMTFKEFIADSAKRGKK